MPRSTGLAELLFWRPDFSMGPTPYFFLVQFHWCQCTWGQSMLQSESSCCMIQFKQGWSVGLENSQTSSSSMNYYNGRFSTRALTWALIAYPLLWQSQLWNSGLANTTYLSLCPHGAKSASQHVSYGPPVQAPLSGGKSSPGASDGPIAGGVVFI